MYIIILIIYILKKKRRKKIENSRELGFDDKDRSLFSGWYHPIYEKTPNKKRPKYMLTHLWPDEHTCVNLDRWWPLALSMNATESRWHLPSCGGALFRWPELAHSLQIILPKPKSVVCIMRYQIYLTVPHFISDSTYGGLGYWAPCYVAPI